MWHYSSTSDVDGVKLHFSVASTCGNPALKLSQPMSATMSPSRRAPQQPLMSTVRYSSHYSKPHLWQHIMPRKHVLFFLMPLLLTSPYRVSPLARYLGPTIYKVLKLPLCSKLPQHRCTRNMPSFFHLSVISYVSSLLPHSLIITVRSDELSVINKYFIPLVLSSSRRPKCPLPFLHAP